jgi:hypothetical protein
MTSSAAEMKYMRRTAGSYARPNLQYLFTDIYMHKKPCFFETRLREKSETTQNCNILHKIKEQIVK